LADWLRDRCRSGPFTTRGSTAELAARGIKTDRRAVWVFVRAEGLSFKKTDSVRLWAWAIYPLGGRERPTAFWWHVPRKKKKVHGLLRT
jgi:hypothetical protein